jgi:hypothetical protein
MTQLGNPCKYMLFKAKKSEKNAKIWLPSSGIPVGWYHKLMILIYIMFNNERTIHYAKH